MFKKHNNYMRAMWVEIIFTMSRYDIIECHSWELYRLTMHTNHVLKYGSSTYKSCVLVKKEDKTHGTLKHTRFKNANNCCLFHHKMCEAIWLALPTFQQWSRNVCKRDQRALSVWSSHTKYYVLSNWADKGYLWLILWK